MAGAVRSAGGQRSGDFMDAGQPERFPRADEAWTAPPCRPVLHSDLRNATQEDDVRCFFSSFPKFITILKLA